MLSICIQEYDDKAFENRKGCDIDQLNIMQLFGKSGYDFDIIYRNSEEKLDAEHKGTRYIDKNMYTVLIRRAQYQLMNHCDAYDGFLCFISAHGQADTSSGINNSMIILSDGTAVRVKDDLLNKFTNSKDALNNKFLGKPKIFVLQACRGSKKAEAIMATTSEPKYADGNQSNKVNNFNNEDIENPNHHAYNAEEGFIILQATAGNKSFRCPETGSYLITEFTKLLLPSNNDHEDNGLKSQNRMERFEITDPVLLQKMKSAANGTEFKGPEFTMFNGKSKWYITIYPNGSNSKSKGHVKFQLKCSGLPESISAIMMRVKYIFDENGTNRECTMLYKPGHLSWGWNSKALKTSDIQYYDSLIFKIKIKVISMINSDGNEVTDQYIYKSSSGSSSDEISLNSVAHVVRRNVKIATGAFQVVQMVSTVDQEIYFKVSNDINVFINNNQSRLKPASDDNLPKNIHLKWNISSSSGKADIIWKDGKVNTKLGRKWKLEYESYFEGWGKTEITKVTWRKSDKIVNFESIVVSKSCALTCNNNTQRENLVNVMKGYIGSNKVIKEN